MAATLAIRMLTPFIFAPLQRLLEQHEYPLGTAYEHEAPDKADLYETPFVVHD
jgi:hypothetical protein